MVAGQPIFGDCRIPWGTLFSPSNTTLGITTPESEFLGRMYWAKGPDGTPRVIRIVKNSLGSALSARQLTKYSTSTGRFGLDVTLATGDQDAPAGAVEEGYAGGVPDAKWFRLVVYAARMSLILQSTSDARNTVAVGGWIVCAADDGTFTGQNTVSLAAIQNRVGRSLQATTNVTDAAALIPCWVAIQE